LNEATRFPASLDQHVSQTLGSSGIGFRDLIDKLIELAMEMHHEKSRTKYAIELRELWRRADNLN